MSKIARVYQRQFGISGPAGDFGVFGSKANPPQTFSMNPVAIQSLQAFLNGWGSSIIGNYQPPMEDMNSLFLLAFRQICYILQEGIVEWETTTIYYTGSIVKVNGIIYNSLIDNNSGIDPSTDTGINWQQGLGGINGGVPTGAILPWSGPSNAIPAGYILGDGTAINRTTYRALFNVIGTLYGAGNGTTTFNLPNGKGRVLVGQDGTTEFLAPGNFGGEKSHLLTIAEIPAHNHGKDSYRGGYNAGGDWMWAWNAGNGYTGKQYTDSVGGDSPHNNLQPYLVIGGIIIKI